jgi:hypothetical protein
VSVKLAIAKRLNLCQMKKICNKKVNRRHKARHGNKARRERISFNLVVMETTFA